MADAQVKINTRGLAKLNRDLGRISKDMRKSSLRHLREIAKDVRTTARRFAPEETGALKRSLRYSARNRGATVYSNLPYAPVHEYGGTIRPRGTPIAIERSRMVGKAVQADAQKIEEEMGRLLDRIARENGFR